MIRTYEEISNNAWPSLQSLQYDGWTLRLAAGVTKRSNSVSLLYPSRLDPEEKITFCESLYRSQGIPPCFKITEIADPADMDRRLAGRGYELHSTISFQTLDIRSWTGEPDRSLFSASGEADAWIGEFIRMNGFDPVRAPVYHAILEQLLLPACRVALTEAGQTVAVGLGVLEKDHVGLFDIVVDPACRGRGLGYRVVDEILRWGREHGAATAYLQVLSDNMPALNLYKKMGFSEAYAYWYRMKAL